MELVKSERRGDPSALAVIKGFLKYPGLADSLGGDLAAKAQSLLIETAAGDDLVLQAAVAQKASDLRAELGGLAPSAVERLLVERVVTGWLLLHRLEIAYCSVETPEAGGASNRA